MSSRLPVLPHLLPHLFVLQLLVLEPGQLSRQPLLLLQLPLPLLLPLLALAGAKLPSQLASGRRRPAGPLKGCDPPRGALPQPPQATPAAAPRPHPPHGLVQPPLLLHRSPQPGRPPPPAALLRRRVLRATRDRRWRRAALTQPGGARRPPAIPAHHPSPSLPPGPPAPPWQPAAPASPSGAASGKWWPGGASRRAPGAIPPRSVT